MSIPLSLFQPHDSLIWTAENNGGSTTKSAYHVARSCSEASGDVPSGSHLNVDTRFLWKALWRAKIPGKVKIGGGVAGTLKDG
ncbi:hypothetical protein C1H46_044511 [Malus baccata]|uniref:Uncharacterized protein n=1 Tax=Malus baccata TaxID=106549 RepID=A0A540K6V7_MALBA|nr:hypothetical protein C1H46_044511 [Malus baccata]